MMQRDTECKCYLQLALSVQIAEMIISFDQFIVYGVCMCIFFFCSQLHPGLIEMNLHRCFNSLSNNSVT